MQIIVLGMRSGSSVITRLINLLGLSVGPVDQLMKASVQNPKGFWENETVVQFNNRLLKTQGCVWNSIGSLDPREISPETRPTEAEEARIILQRMDSERPWVLKDPRMSLLLPFWIPLLESPVFVIVFRHPLEVAYSLKTHHNMPILCGLALWEQYTRVALRHSVGTPRLLVSYNAIMRDPVGTLKVVHDRLAAFQVTHLRLPDADEITTFVDPTLYREKSDVEAVRAMVSPAQQELHTALENGSALEWTEVPELSPNARELLEIYDEIHLRRWNDKVNKERLATAEKTIAALKSARSGTS